MQGERKLKRVWGGTKKGRKERVKEGTKDYFSVSIRLTCRIRAYTRYKCVHRLPTCTTHTIGFFHSVIPAKRVPSFVISDIPIRRGKREKKKEREEKNEE